MTEIRDHPVRGGSSSRRWWVLLLLCAAFFMVVTDSTVVYAALPSIGHGLGLVQVQWVVIAYLLTSGGLLLLGGRVADLVDRRRIFVGGVGLFSAMSVVCAVAWTGGVLIAARALQGVGAAIMVPAALAILTSTFPDGAERNRALGLWGGLAGIGATAGLLLGGPITELLGWRSVFLINVPVAALVLMLAPVLLPAFIGEPPRRRGLDLAGGLTSTLALLALVYAVVQAPQRGGSGLPTVAPLAVAALMAIVFVQVERRAADPLVPLRIFRSWTLVGGNLTILVAGISVDGLLYTFTLLAQGVLDYSATHYGLTMALMTGISFVGVAGGQHLVSQLGARPVAVAGLLLVGLGALLLTQVTTSSVVGPTLAGLLLFGPGMGAVFVAGQIAALAGVADAEAGLAAGVEETTFAIGSVLGVAVLSSVVRVRGDLLAGARTAFVAIVVVVAVGLLATLLIPRGTGRHTPGRRSSGSAHGDVTDDGGGGTPLDPMAR